MFRKPLKNKFQVNIVVVEISYGIKSGKYINSNHTYISTFDTVRFGWK